MQQIEIAEKKLYDLASDRPDRRRLQAVPRRADRGDGRGRGGLQSGGPAHRRGDRPVPARPAAGRPAPVRSAHPRRPSLDGKDGARHQHRLQCRQGLSRGASSTARPRRSTARWSASSRSKCRPSSSPRACSPSRPRCPSEKIRKGELISSRLRQGAGDQPRARAPQLLHRRHAGAQHRRPAHPRPPAEAHARARPADRRLPPAAQPRRASRARRTACRRSRRSPAASRRWPRSSTCRCWRCRSSAAPSSSARTSGRSSPTCANRARSSRTPTS